MLLVFILCVLLQIVILVGVFVKANKEYQKGAYYQITKFPLLAVKHDLGRYGEYLIYKYLKPFETSGAKFLFNTYIPKENGETTEIDVIMLCTKGLFVFESKNYSGWIFGNENQKNWYQTLPAGRGKSHKESFFNPIIQNRSHIKHLKTLLGEQVPMWSVITFSERCTLKDIKKKSEDVYVINRYNVYELVVSICNRVPNQLLTEEEVNDLYNKLYPYTQLDIASKVKHIADIQNHLQKTPKPSTQQTIPPINSNQCAGTNPLVPNIEATLQQTALAADAPIMAATQQLKCPKCGANLVLRTARRGERAGKQFYGCSNYPKCRFIQNMTEN